MLEFIIVVFVNQVPARLLRPRTIARQAPLSIGFPRQEYLSVLLFPSQWDFPNPGIEPETPALQADSLPLNHQGRQSSLC